MAILVDSTTASGAKNRWGTLHECFNDGQFLYGRRFSVDVCAEPQTAKVDRYFINPEWLELQPQWHTHKYDALKKSSAKVVGFDALQCKWDRDWWCNPPFDLKILFAKKAAEEAKQGRPGMMLLPYEPLTGWWLKHVKPHVSFIYEPDGRYQFYETDGVTKKTGANFGSCFVIFDSHYVNEPPRINFKRGIGNK